METKNDSITAGGHSRVAAVVVAIAHAFAHLNNQSLNVLWPVLMKEFQFGYTGVAVLQVIGQITSGPIQAIYGMVTRFIRRLRLMSLGQLVTFLGALGIAASQHYVHLLVGRAVRQLGTSPNHPVGGAILADAFPKSRTQALAWNHISGSIGGWVAALAVGGLLLITSWRWVVLLLALPLLPMSVLFFFTKEPGAGTAAKEGRKQRAKLGLREYKTAIRDRNTLILVLVMMAGAVGGGAGGFTIYLAPFMVDRFGVTVPFAAMFVAANTAGSALGAIALGRIADRTSPLLVLRIALALACTFLLVFLMLDTPGILLGIVVFLVGAFIGSRGSLTQSMLISLGPKDVRTETMLSVYYGLSAFIGILWHFAIGLVADNFGITPTIILLSASYVVGAFLLNFMKAPPTEQVTQANT